MTDKRIERALAAVEKAETPEEKKAVLQGLLDDEQWGPGDKFDVFDHVMVENTVFELGQGKHPYSRQSNSHYGRPMGLEDREPVGFDGHRRPWHIQIMESNYMKSSDLSGDEIRRACGARLYWVLPNLPTENRGAYLKLVYAFSHRTAEACLRMIPSLLLKLSEHPVNLAKGNGPDDFSELVGRKVYYQNVPAVVRYYFPDQGAVVVEPVDGHLFPISPWHKEDMLDAYEAKEAMESVKVDFFTEHLWWFRD